MQNPPTPTTTRSGTTTAAAVIHLALMGFASIVCLWLLVLVGIFGQASKSSNAGSLSGILMFLVLVALAFCGVGIWLGVKLLQRRDWARWTLVVLYGLGALSQLSNIANGRGGGVLGLGIYVAVLVLLLHSATARDCSSKAAAHAAALAAPLPHPPGWYADPQNPEAMRYWDGRGWTEHSAPRQ